MVLAAPYRRLFFPKPSALQLYAQVSEVAVRAISTVHESKCSLTGALAAASGLRASKIYATSSHYEAFIRNELNKPSLIPRTIASDRVTVHSFTCNEAPSFLTTLSV